MHRHDEIQACQDRGESDDEHTDHREHDVGVGEERREGSVERPAGIHSAGDQGGDDEQSPQGINVPARQIQAGEGHLARADHERNEEVAESGGNRGNQEEPHHDDAMRGEQLVVGFRIHHIPCRRQQLEAHQGCGSAAEKEEAGDRDHVKQSDALVVPGQQPRPESEALAQIARLVQNLLGTDLVGGCCAHGGLARDLM